MIRLVNTFIISQIYHFSCVWWEHLSKCSLVVVPVVQSLYCVLPFATPGFPVLHPLPEHAQIMSIKSVMPSNQLILCYPLLLLPPIFHSFRVFSNELGLHIRWPEYWSFSYRSALPTNIQNLFPLRLISLQFKGLTRVLSNTTVQKHQCFGAQPSLWSNSHMYTWPLKNHNLIIWTIVS